MRHVQDCLSDLEQRWNDRNADPLFAAYPIARPITVDSIHGGEWQGMVCDHCTCAGYLELLPGDDVSRWITQFETELRQGLMAKGCQTDRVAVRFSEQYDGHLTSPAHAFCRAAEDVVRKSSGQNAGTGSWASWSAFNSGCEAGLRAKLLGTPTLVWGPGSLAQAHAIDEFVDFQEVHAVAGRMASLAAVWSRDAAAANVMARH
jgi:acetylornithine deacetylase